MVLLSYLLICSFTYIIVELGSLLGLSPDIAGTKRRGLILYINPKLMSGSGSGGEDQGDMSGSPSRDIRSRGLSPNTGNN